MSFMKLFFSAGVLLFFVSVIAFTSSLDIFETKDKNYSVDKYDTFNVTIEGTKNKTPSNTDKVKGTNVNAGYSSYDGMKELKVVLPDSRNSEVGSFPANQRDFLTLEDIQSPSYVATTKDTDPNIYSSLQFYDAYDWTLPSQNEVYGQVDSKRIFVNKIGSILLDLNRNDDKKNTNEAFISFFNKNDKTKEDVLRNVVSQYRQAAEAISKLQNIPDDARSIVTSLSRSYLKSADALETLIEAENKDYRNLMLQYNKAAEDIVRNILRLTYYVKLNNIEFSAVEPGYVFIFIF